MRKPIQLIHSPANTDIAEYTGVIYALCDDGTIWNFAEDTMTDDEHGNSTVIWTQLNPVPRTAADKFAEVVIAEPAADAKDEAPLSGEATVGGPVVDGGIDGGN